MTLPKWATTVTPFSKTLALIIFTTFPIISFILGMQYQKLLTQTYLINNTSKSVQQTSYLSPSKNVVAYKITITNIKKPINDYLELVLSSLLLKEKFTKENFKIFTNDYQIVFNNDKKANWYVNKPLFILITGDSNKLETNKIYESDFFSVKVENASAIIPYLVDRKYCIQDEDCSIRYEWCEKGSWNKYSQFISAIGCQFGNNEGQTLEIEEAFKQCSTTEGTGIIADYSGSKCLNNSCTALSPKFKCVSNTDGYFKDMGKLSD